MSDDDATLTDFVALSSALTGFAVSVLKPRTDAQEQAAQYLAFLRGPESGVADALPALLAVYRAHATESPAAIGAAVMTSPSAELARRIIKLWYTGSWYGPFDPENESAPMERVVTSQAYTNGLVWRVGQAHPMGHSLLRFGYWNGPPPPLSDFTGSVAGPSSTDAPGTATIGGPDHA